MRQSVSVAQAVEVRIRSTTRDVVTIQVLGRMHANATDFWDGNWLVSPVKLELGAFTGRLEAGLRVDELANFREQLQVLYRTLEGEARLQSIENWLILVAKGDGLGHIEVVGAAMDEPGTGNELRFRLELDQTYLPEIIDSLAQVEAAFPVLGRP
jgi:hypothetical protein